MTLEKIHESIRKLYDSVDNIPQESVAFLEAVFRQADYEKVYNDIIADEKNSRDILVEFEKEYPGAINMSNSHDILNALKSKRDGEKRS